MDNFESEIKPYLEGLSKGSTRIVLEMVSGEANITLKCLDDFFALSYNELKWKLNGCGKKRATEIYEHIQKLKKLHSMPPAPSEATLEALQNVIRDVEQISSRLTSMKIHDVSAVEIDTIIHEMTKVMQKTLKLKEKI